MCAIHQECASRAPGTPSFVTDLRNSTGIPPFATGLQNSAGTPTFATGLQKSMGIPAFVSGIVLTEMPVLLAETRNQKQYVAV